MARPKSNTPKTPVHIMVPDDILARIKLMLWSDLEEKIPHGATSEFFVQLAREFFDAKLKPAPTPGASDAAPN